MFIFRRQQPSPDTHPLHPQHTGRVESDAVSVQRAASLLECSNCKIPLPGKPTFHCKICEYYLCHECNTNYEHPVHVQHTLNRVCNPEQQSIGLAPRCNVCCKEIVDSVIRYRCSTCDFDVCQECFAPKMHPLHKHGLLKTDVRHVYISSASHGEWYCDSCGNNNGPGNYTPWHCKSCQYDLCDNCAKPWVSNAHPEHKLLKSDSRIVYPSYNGGWACDRCKMTFNPEVNDKPFHCQQCEYDLCDSCLKETVGNQVGFDIPRPNQMQWGQPRQDTDDMRSGDITMQLTHSGKPIATPHEDAEELQIAKRAEEPNRSNSGQDDCLICLAAPKNSTIVHGLTGHVCCCYNCAMRLTSLGQPCPICREPIDRVIRQYTA